MLKFPAASRRPRLSATEVTGTTVDASTAPAGPETPPRTPWTRLDRLCLAILVLVPTVGFSVPAALGYPVVPGDDRFQNLPLRMLAGQLLRHGHWPVWDRWTWSGTPLLGGFNAGAAYPGTLLFALASPVLAWTLNEIGVYVVAGVGLYALLRHHRLMPAAALVGAASGTYAGLLAVHLCNIGLVQGLCWTPWLLLSLDHLEDASRFRWAWWTVSCATGGLVILSGEPRAVSNVAITAAIYLGGALWRSRRRWQLLLMTFAAASMALAIGAAQLLPGLAFLATSQRSSVPYEYFSLGSLDPHFWPLQLVPYFLGPFQRQLSYVRAESLGYIGLLPLVALVTVPFWRRRAERRTGTWLAMYVIGVVLALGPNTPLGPLLHRIPFYGGQRMQYRNMGIASLGLAGLLACWTDALLGSRGLRGFAERLLSLLPPLAAVCVVLTVRQWSAILPEAPDPRLWARLITRVSVGYLVMTLLLAFAAGFLAFGWERLRAGVRVWALLAIVALDLGVGLSQQDFAPVSVHAMLGSAPEATRIANLFGEGRFALFDPNQRAADSELLTLFSPDLAGLHGWASVQGFGSVVDATYWEQTGSHFIRHLDPSVLAGELADELDLRVVLLPRSYLVQARGDPRPADPDLALALEPPHWREVEGSGDLRLFVNTRSRGRVWLEPAPSAPAYQVAATTIGEDDHEVDRVSSEAPATLVRSVAYADGWNAVLRAADGDARVLPVFRHGLLQAATIPAGSFTVEWSYSAPRATLGLALSSVAGLALGVLLLALRLRSRAAPARGPAPGA
jgi:hypothetical protein